MIKILLLTLSAVILGTGLFNLFEEAESSPSVVPAHIYTLYSKWTVKYGVLRSSPSERDFRVRNFYKTYLNIRELRVRYSITEFGLNKFSDLTDAEFAAGYTGLEHVAPEDQPEEKLLESDDSLAQTAYPSSYLVPNQREVRDQGFCRSCWAWAIKHVTQDLLKGTVEISTQNIMNCNKEGKNCNGGWLDWGIEAVNTYGYKNEDEVPYRGGAGSCTGMGIKINRKPRVRHNLRDQNTFKRQMYASRSGVAIAVSAENYTWRSFTGGVFDTSDDTCRSSNVNHGVTLIGWNDTKNVFRLRNSWGSDWGEEGYMWIKMNKNLNSPGNCICGALPGDFNCQAVNWE